MSLKHLVLTLVLVTASAITTPAAAQGGWRAHRGGPHDPPPAVIVETPHSRPGYVWVGGHHEWRHRHYVWVGGRLARERRGHDWEDGRWDRHDDHYDWHRGGWRMHR